MDWEDLEALYWQFDAMHRGYGAWEGRPTNEKDAFKRTVKRALTENVVLYAKQVDAYRQLMEEAVRLRETLKDNGDDIRHLMASVMQLVPIVRSSIGLSDVTQGVLYKAEHLIKVLSEKQFHQEQL